MRRAACSCGAITARASRLVYALQLPFLFDGEISPKRVGLDGDSARQMAWHLLMDDLHDSRTGYTSISLDAAIRTMPSTS